MSVNKQTIPSRISYLLVCHSLHESVLEKIVLHQLNLTMVEFYLFNRREMINQQKNRFSYLVNW